MAECDASFGERVGTMDFFDWDFSVARAIGAVVDVRKNIGVLFLDDILRPLPSECVSIADKNLRVSKAIVIFEKTEPETVKSSLPEILILRDSSDPRDESRHSASVAYRVPCPGAKLVSAAGCIGATEWESKDADHPWNFNYTIEVRARYRSLAQVMIQMMLARFPPRSFIDVMDSIGNIQTFTAYLESGPSDLTEVNTTVERIAGFSIGVRFEGALTLDRVPFSVPGFTGIRRPHDPFNPDDPDSGPFGYYGDGKAQLTIEPDDAPVC